MKLYANDLEDWEPLDEDDDEPAEVKTEPDPDSFEAFVARRGLDPDELIERNDSTWDDLWAEWSHQEDARRDQERAERRATEAQRELEARTAREMGSVRSQLADTKAKMKEVAEAIQSTDNLIERHMLGSELARLEDHAARLETSLPFVGLHDEAFTREVEDREIAARDASRNLAALEKSDGSNLLEGGTSPELRRARREAEEAARALTAARREQVRRREAEFVSREKQKLLETQARRRLGKLRHEALTELDRRLRREGVDPEERALRVRLHAKRLDQREDELLVKVRKDLEGRWGTAPPPDPLAEYLPDNPGALMPRNLQPVPSPPPRRPADTSRGIL